MKTAAVVVNFFSLFLAQEVFSQATCPPENFDAVSDFQVERFVDERWFSNRQLPTRVQPVDQLNCVYADYEIISSTKCRFFGWLPFVCESEPARVSVFNYGRIGDVDGNVNSIKFELTVPNDDEPAKGNVGPGFIPNVLRKDTNYWVVAVGEYNDLDGVDAPANDDFYEWAIITTGAPETVGENDLCYTASGFWFFLRDPVAPDGVIDAMTTIATDLGLDTSVFEPVEHTGCDYSGRGGIIGFLRATLLILGSFLGF